MMSFSRSSLKWVLVFFVAQGAGVAQATRPGQCRVLLNSLKRGDVIHLQDLFYWRQKISNRPAYAPDLQSFERHLLVEEKTSDVLGGIYIVRPVSFKALDKTSPETPMTLPRISAGERKFIRFRKRDEKEVVLKGRVTRRTIWPERETTEGFEYLPRDFVPGQLVRSLDTGKFLFVNQVDYDLAGSRTFQVSEFSFDGEGQLTAQRRDPVVAFDNPNLINPNLYGQRYKSLGFSLSHYDVTPDAFPRRFDGVDVEGLLPVGSYYSVEGSNFIVLGIEPIIQPSHGPGALMVEVAKLQPDDFLKLKSGLPLLSNSLADRASHVYKEGSLWVVDGRGYFKSRSAINFGGTARIEAVVDQASVAAKMAREPRDTRTFERDPMQQVVGFERIR